MVVGHSLAYVIARHAPMPHGTSCALALLVHRRITLYVEPGSQAISPLPTRSGARASRKPLKQLYALATTLDLPRSLAAVGIAELRP